MLNRPNFRYACFLTLLLTLVACGGDDNGPATPGVEIASAPTNVQVTPGDESNVISWNPSSGASSYNIYWKMGAGATTADSMITGVTSPYTHTSLINGTLYSYVVTAVNSAGESGASSEAQGTPSAPGAPPVYVSATTGLDTNAGTQSSPVKTLGRAYAAAGIAGSTLIKMEAASYNEPVVIRSGINIEGGYTVPGWTRGSLYTSFNVGVSPATGSDILVATVISQVEFKASNSATNNSIALYSNGSNANLEFRDCRFIAGSGATGAAGRLGQTGADGLNGGNGGRGDGSRDSGSAGGLGGAGGGGIEPIGFCHGGNGGNGGSQEQNGGVGAAPNGCFGNTLTPLGGAGGSAGDPGNPGSPGVAGNPGGAGSHAQPSPDENKGGIGSGIEQWVPFVSNTGQTGVPGTGGSGGGGGGGEDAFCCDDGGGNGGGGGGGPGAGGGGGLGGQGGYGSFAVFLFESSPTFVDCYFATGSGGNGGAGGNGGNAGIGGSGGLGGTGATSEIGAGGNGGSGADGGRGGGGAGGAGGPSYGVYKAVGGSIELSTPDLQSPTYAVGSPGGGGLGGTGSSTGRAGGGEPGLSGNTN